MTVELVQDNYPDDSPSEMNVFKYTNEQSTHTSMTEELRLGLELIDEPDERLDMLVRLQDIAMPTYLIAGAFENSEATELDGNDTKEGLEANLRTDRYHHIKFHEMTDPDLALEAWKIHAEGYYAMGFLKPEAITSEGLLSEGIDKSQGDNTDYYLALNPESESDCATMRIVNLPKGGTYEDLPAYHVLKDNLSEDGIDILQSIDNQDSRLKEIAAMSRTRSANPIAVHEIIRKVIQEAQGNDEVWFFSIVSTTFESLTRTLGEQNFTVIGEDAPIEDERVSADVALRPALFYPDKFFDTLANAYNDAPTKREKARLRRSILFFTDGMIDTDLSDTVLKTKSSILNSKQGVNG